MSDIAQIAFVNDGSLVVKAPVHPNTNLLAERPHKEPLLRQVVRALFETGTIDPYGAVVDLGCWIGDNSIPWAMMTEGIVCAIDPSPDNLAFVALLASANGLGNVRCIEGVVSERVEELGTYQDLSHSMFHATAAKPDEDEWTQTLVAVTLDHLYRDGQVPRTSFLHLDVEGMELKVLRGASGLVSECKPVIAFESHIHSADRPGLVVSLLEDLGYSVYMINEVLPGCMPDCRNFLALPTRKDATVAQIERQVQEFEPAFTPAHQGLRYLITSNCFSLDSAGRFRLH